MAGTVHPFLVKVLRACASVAPQPLYPAAYVQAGQAERAELDAALDHLRLAGLVQLTDWVKDLGQGYTLTDDGRRILENPFLLSLTPTAATPAQPTPAEDSLDQQTQEIRDAFLQPRKPVVARLLLGSIVAVFLLGAILAERRGIPMNDFLDGGRGPNIDKIFKLQLDMGMVSRPNVLDQDQWWRLLTYAFLHAGLLHLLMNGYSLHLLGPFLEAVWGKWRFLALYLIGAWFGGLAVVMANSIAVGASGALCGLLTSVAAWLWLSKDHLPPEVFQRGINNVLVNGMLMVVISFFPGISWPAHFGGALGGALASFPLYWTRYGHGWQKWVGYGGLAILPMAGLILVGNLQPQADKVQSRFGLEMNEIERDLIPAFNNYAKELLNQGGGALENDPEKIRQARAAFGQLLDRIHPLLDRLRNSKPYADPTLAQDVDRAIAYLEAMSDFFTTAERWAARPLDWTPADDLRLHEEDRLFHERRKATAASTVLKSSLQYGGK